MENPGEDGMSEISCNKKYFPSNGKDEEKYYTEEEKTAHIALKRSESVNNQWVCA